MLCDSFLCDAFIDEPASCRPQVNFTQGMQAMTQEPNPFTAAWSRNGNLLCHGHWIITFEERPVTLPQH